MSNTSDTILPEPRRTVTELPDQAAVDAAGIDLDLETAQLVACVIFRQAIRGRCRARIRLYNATMGLVFMAHEPLDRNGEHEPAPFPGLRFERWPQGPRVFEKLGITHGDLEIYGIKARHQADDAVLPMNWALAFYPAEIWPMIAKLVEWGPERTSLRLERAVMTMARTPTKHQRRRRDAGEPLSLSTIKNYVDGVFSLTDALVELRSIATGSDLVPLAPLEAWTTKPAQIDVRALGATDANQDNTGPGVEACSDRLKQLARAAHNTTSRDGYIKRRAAVLMGILPLHGPRDGALREVDVADYRPQHRYPDGSRGPALVIKPGKSRPHDELHFLPLPVELARWVEDWITFTGRHIGQPDEPFFPSRKPRPGRPNQRISVHGFYNAIAGARQTGGTGSYCLLPLDDDPFIGYRPHAYRYTANQLIIDAAARMQRADPTFYPHVAPDKFAKAVLGHELITDITAVYSGLDRQLLSKAVIDAAWQILWDDGIRNRGPNPDRIRAVRERREALIVTRDALRAAAVACDAQAERLILRADATGDKPRKLELKLDAATQQNTAHTHRDELRRIEADLADAEAELHTARTEQLPIPDDRSNEEHELLVDAAIHGAEPEPERPTTGPLADEITVRDTAELWDVSEQTINRAYRKGQPTAKPLKWVGGKTAWHHYHAKDKRLRVDAINHAELTPDQQQRLLELRQQRARLDAEMFHPAVKVSSKHGATRGEHTMTDSPTTSRQTVDGLIDAWQTSGSSPPNGRTNLPGAEDQR